MQCVDFWVPDKTVGIYVETAPHDVVFEHGEGASAMVVFFYDRGV